MSNVSFIEIEGKEYAIIDRGNDEYTSMPKVDYEEMVAKAEQSTPNLTL